MSQGRRVLIVGDSPLINTGFGRVNAIAAKRFQEEGWEIASVAGLTKEPPKDDKGIKVYVPSDPADVLGIRDIDAAVNDFKPDIAYMTADPGSVTALSYGLPEMPAFAYTPIEGEPISNRDWRLILQTLPVATCSQYGADVAYKTVGRRIPWYYHGIDHDTFKVTGVRDDIRKKFGWEDKFVITCVSTNVRRKQLPRLMEAVSILKHRYKRKDVILYLHTVPFQNYWLEGWNLMEVGAMYGISEELMFHPAMATFNSSIPERGTPDYPGMADIVEACDLFVLPSMVEGLGLPIVEAMACGVPVLVTKYAAGWEVATPAGRGIPIADWEVHKSGTMYANVSPQGLADEILRLMRNPNQLKKMSEAGLERAKDFTWEPFLQNLIPHMEQAIESFTPSSANKEREDQGEEEGQEDVGVRTPEGEASTEDGPDILEGQGEVVASKKPKNPHRKKAKEEDKT